MARIDHLHWQVDAGDSWASTATKCGCSRKALLECNGQPLTDPQQLQKGQIIHVPLLEAGAVG